MKVFHKLLSIQTLLSLQKAESNLNWSQKSVHYIIFLITNTEMLPIHYNVHCGKCQILILIIQCQALEMLNFSINLSSQKVPKEFKCAKWILSLFCQPFQCWSWNDISWIVNITRTVYVLQFRQLIDSLNRCDPQLCSLSTFNK